MGEELGWLYCDTAGAGGAVVVGRSLVVGDVHAAVFPGSRTRTFKGLLQLVTFQRVPDGFAAGAVGSGAARRDVARESYPLGRPCRQWQG